MTTRIFHTPPLGKLSDQPSSESGSDAASVAAPKTRKRRDPQIPDIPPQPAYRVESLARFNTLGAKWRTEAMRSHRTPTLLWFTRGQGRLTVSGVTRGFGPHNLVFMPTRTMYGFEPIGQISGFVVHLPESDTSQLPETPVHLRFMEVSQQNELTGLIEGLAKEITSDEPCHDRAVSLHAQMLSIWLERQLTHMPDYEMTPDASRRLVAAFTALVEQGFREGHTLTHYANALGVTPTHLTRACKISNGKSASQLLTDRVHFEARRLLHETDLPIKDIAAKLGFQSPAYFSRAFSKNTGHTPRAFRKAQAQG